jgi:pantoate--beta-alanine ligase
MQIYHDIAEWREVRNNIPDNLSIGFVPTMGNLHLGHGALVSKSTCENDITVASIFINRTQFNQIDDYNKYPRTLDKDIELLEKIGINYCLIPNEQDMYHDDYHFQIHETEFSKKLEGEFRPGHFNGVLSIVMKLFNLVKPHRSYFGEKDYQQYQLIKDMCAAFFMDIEIKALETIRESSGLAYSSRNNRLTTVEKQIAETYANIFLKSESCEETMQKLIELGIHVDYIQDYNSRRYIAVKIGDIRLIDNKKI